MRIAGSALTGPIVRRIVPARGLLLRIAGLGCCVAAALFLATSPDANIRKHDPFEAGVLGAVVREYDFAPERGGHVTLTSEGRRGRVLINVALKGEVTYPARLAASRPLPLVLIMHGLAATCVDADKRPVFDAWPCDAKGLAELPSYRGYGPLAKLLASHGYVVASIDAAGLTDLPSEPETLKDAGDGLRAELIRRHLDFWAQVQRGEVERFKALAGRIDFGRVGLVGHSRGGSGVVRFVVDHRKDPGGVTLRAAALIAPANNYIETSTTIPEVHVPFFVAAPYCDASVDDLNGLLFYDHARYRDFARGNWNTYGVFLGANHNYFNTIWSPSGGSLVRDDDWVEHSGEIRREDPHCGRTSPHRLSDVEQSQLGAGYVAMFLRWHVGDERVWAPYVQGTAALPERLDGRDKVLLTTQPPESHRLVINAFGGSNDLARNALGGAVRIENAATELCPRLRSSRWIGCITGRRPRTIIETYNEPHALQLTALAVRWHAGKPLSIVNEVPAGHGDLSTFDYLQLRIGVDYRGMFAAGVLDDFRVILKDAKGRTAALPLQGHPEAMRPMPGRPGITTRLLLNAVRVPLAQARGVDLARIRSIELRSGVAGDGRVVLADLIAWRSQVGPAAVPDATALTNKRPRGGPQPRKPS